MSLNQNAKDNLPPQHYVEQSQELCVLPDIYLRLKDKLYDESCSLNDIAELISLEPTLASRLLKIANSAMFNFPREIESINAALRIIGLQEVGNLIDAYGVTAAFSGLDPEVLDIDKFWEVSVDCALLCKYFAKEKQLKSPNTLFLSGLFHDIGELVLVHSEREKVQHCEQYDKGTTPWSRQKEQFGFTFADCSFQLLKHWQLPDSICQPIAAFNRGYAEELSLEASVLYVASRLAVCNSHPGRYNPVALIGQHVLDDLGISKQDIELALNYCNAEGFQLSSTLKL